MTNEIKQPSGVRFIAIWTITVFVSVTLLTWITMIFFPAPDSTYSKDALFYYIISTILALVLGGMSAGYAILAGAVHSLLRSPMRRALSKSLQEGRLFLIPYRLINLVYGFAVGLAFGLLGLCAIGDRMELLLFIGGNVLFCGIVGVGVGELVRPKFEIQNNSAAFLMR